MNGHCRRAILSLTCGLAVCIGSALWAGPRPVPVRPAQLDEPGKPPAAAASYTPPPPIAVAPLPGSPCPDDPPTPVVGIRVRVPACSVPGEEIEYRICVENRSPADAHHVVVRNPLPANARFIRSQPAPTSLAPDLAWELGTLPGCSRREISLVLLPAGPGDIVNCARVQFEHGQCVTTRVGGVAAAPVAGGLKIQIGGPGQAKLNDLLTYQITVTHQGSNLASNVSVIVKLGDGLEHPSTRNTLAFSLGTLNPGQIKQVEFQATARKAGRLCCHAAASGDGGLFDENERCVLVGEAPPAVQEGRLALVITGPTQCYLSRAATYQITVSNPSPVPLTGVVVTHVVPAGMSVVSVGEAGRVVGNQVQWRIGTLPPGARRTVQIALQARQPGEIVNRATAVADFNLTAEAEAKTLFEGATGLTFDIEVKDNPVEVGGQTAYIVTVLNQGNAPATGIRLAVKLPDEMQYLSAQAPTEPQVQGQQISFAPLANLPPQVETRYVIHVRVQRNGEKAVKCKAELRADQLGDRPVIREQLTTIYPDSAPLRPVPKGN